jgi:hypothetical protein
MRPLSNRNTAHSVWISTTGDEPARRNADAACARSLKKSRANRDALNLQHDSRVRKTGHRDGRAGGEVFAKQLGAQFRHPRGVAGIDQEYRHRDNIRQFAAGFHKRFFDIAKRLVKLRIEITRKRAAIGGGPTGMARDPNDRLGTLRDHSR